MEYISINKLFEKLNEITPEDKIKCVHIYFDNYIVDMFDKKQMNVEPLMLALVMKEGEVPSVQKITYKQLRDMFPNLRYFKVPTHIFRKHLEHSDLTQKVLLKVVIDAKRTKFMKSFYHKATLLDVKDQDKLKALQDERSNVKIEILDSIAKKCNKHDEDEDLNEIIPEEYDIDYL